MGIKVTPSEIEFQKTWNNSLQNKKEKETTTTNHNKARKGGFSSKVILNSLANLHRGIGYPFGGGGGNPLYGLFRYMRPQRV